MFKWIGTIKGVAGTVSNAPALVYEPQTNALSALRELVFQIDARVPSQLSLLSADCALRYAVLPPQCGYIWQYMLGHLEGQMVRCI
jgi:hypothetical protein